MAESSILDEDLHRTQFETEGQVQGLSAFVPTSKTQCDVCFKVFATPKGLQQHAVIHTDEKPFACDVCGKAFRFKSNLFEHKSLHAAGNVSHQCPFCGKACRLKGNLKKHLRQHVSSKEELDQIWRPFVRRSSTDAVVNDNTPLIKGQGQSSSTKALPSSRSRNRRMGLGNSSAEWVKKIRNNDLMKCHGVNDKLQHTCALIQSAAESQYTLSECMDVLRALPFEQYACPDCKAMFMSRVEAIEHLAIAHDSQGDQRDLFCEVCMRQFKNPEDFGQHERYHKQVAALVANGHLILTEPDHVAPETLMGSIQHNHHTPSTSMGHQSNSLDPGQMHLNVDDSHVSAGVAEANAMLQSVQQHVGHSQMQGLMQEVPGAGAMTPDASGQQQTVARVRLLQNQTDGVCRIVATTISDKQVVLNMTLSASLKYNRATNTFHQWRDRKQVFGLNFASHPDADSFAEALQSALECLQRRKRTGQNEVVLAQPQHNVQQSEYVPSVDNEGASASILSHVHSAPHMQHCAAVVQEQGRKSSFGQQHTSAADFAQQQSAEQYAVISSNASQCTTVVAAAPPPQSNHTAGGGAGSVPAPPLQTTSTVRSDAGSVPAPPAAVPPPPPVAMLQGAAKNESPLNRKGPLLQTQQSQRSDSGAVGSASAPANAGQPNVPLSKPLLDRMASCSSVSSQEDPPISKTPLASGASVRSHSVAPNFGVANKNGVTSVTLNQWKIDLMKEVRQEIVQAKMDIIEAITAELRKR